MSLCRWRTPRGSRRTRTPGARGPSSRLRVNNSRTLRRQFRHVALRAVPHQNRRAHAVKVKIAADLETRFIGQTQVHQDQIGLRAFASRRLPLQVGVTFDNAFDRSAACRRATRLIRCRCGQPPAADAPSTNRHPPAHLYQGRLILVSPVRSVSAVQFECHLLRRENRAIPGGGKARFTYRSACGILTRPDSAFFM